MIEIIAKAQKRITEIGVAHLPDVEIAIVGSRQLFVVILQSIIRVVILIHSCPSRIVTVMEVSAIDVKFITEDEMIRVIIL